MGDNRFAKIGQLLESKNRTLRKEAIEALSNISFLNDHFFIVIHQHLRSSVWEARVASAEILGAVLTNSLAQISNKEPANYSLENHVAVEQLNIEQLLGKYQPLLSCNEGQTSEFNAPVNSSKYQKEQRKLIDLHLDLNSSTGVSSQAFISDDEIGSSSNFKSISNGNNNDVKEDIRKIACDYSNGNAEQQDLMLLKQEQSLEGAVVDGEYAKFRAKFNDIMRIFLMDLVDHKWHIRHGAALAFVKIISSAFQWLTSGQLLQTSIVRMLQLLALDRFNDFVTGSNAVAPVREATAQALSIILLKVDTSDGQHKLLAPAIVRKINALLAMKSEEQWQCRQTALIVLKYYFAMCSFDEAYQRSLFDAVLLAMSDAVDEVVSAATLALSAYFSNPRLSPAEKLRLVNKVMENVWRMLADTDRQTQLLEGVDSLLVDLINLITFWLRIDPDARLNRTQFLLVVGLLDPNFLTRTKQTLECLNAAFKASFDWTGQELFTFLKMLYRIVLFAPYTDSAPLMELVFQTLERFLELVGEKTLLWIAELHQNIGFWLCCLIYDNKHPEIDVFVHCVDGPVSRRNTPLEILCGDEIRFLRVDQLKEALIERKALAARFLAPLLDALFRYGDPQSLASSVQLLFLPYLKANSLYQRLGVSLVANAWARHFRRRRTLPKEKTDAADCPTTLIKEIERCLCEPGTLYDEVAAELNVLGKECNEFQQYCVRKGTPREAILSVDAATNIEDVVSATFQECERRLTKPGDQQTLVARHNFVHELIVSTRTSTRTNTNRVNSLLSAALLHFHHFLTILTPLIRPMIESLDSEGNFAIAEATIYDTFPVLLAATASRIPCPHAKVLRQLCVGLVSCDNFAPKSEKWKASDQRLKVLSVDSDFNEQNVGIRSKNCATIFERISQTLGEDLFAICPELQRACAINGTEDVELHNLEVFRVVYHSVSISFKRKLFANQIQPQAENLLHLLASQNPAIRFRVARFLAELAHGDLSTTLSTFYSRLKAMIGNIQSDTARCGAAELLLRLAQLEHILLGAVSLLTPLALQAIGDQVESVRQAAATAFRKLVVLLGLEDRKKHSLTGLGLDQDLAEEYAQSFALVDILSCPGNLPILNVRQITHLREDVQLRHYQLEGITWLSFLDRFGLNGILADDMGLGKTLQVLCLLDWEQSLPDRPSSPSLIICPRTLVDHWCNEWNNFFPSMPRRLKKLDAWKGGAKLSGLRSGLESLSVLVISYEELRANRRLNEHRWDYVILDEGHCIRNPSSQLFEMVCSLHSAHRLILSGTPVQNSPADLWALFAFLMPGYLSTRANFHTRYMRQILACRSPKATEQQIADGENALQLLHRQCLPFVMRRLKSEVLSELPDKIVQDYPCELSFVQRQLYAEISGRCVALKPQKRDAKSADDQELSPLQALIALRKLVDHPILVTEVLQRINATKIFDPRDSSSRSLNLSGKLIALRELLEECQIGNHSATASAESNQKIDPDQSTTQISSTTLFFSPHRALVFCQWKATIDLIAEFIESGAFGAEITYLRLDGTVPPADRQNVVDQFNTDASIDLLLLTTHIGGVGLNLTGADVVIFVDHDWNPFKDLQAVDRAHRLGQTRTVNVYRLITRGSVEDKVMRLQKFKSDTANVLIGADNRSLTSMATTELMELFVLDEGNDVGTSKATTAPEAKRQKRTVAETAAAGGAETSVAANQWSIEALWDSATQYEEQHSIVTFIESANL